MVSTVSGRLTTHLHDKLNGADEEAEELENQVLLLLLHLIQAKLLAAVQHVLRGQAVPGVGLQQILGHDARAAGLDVLFLLLGAVFGLELLDEGVDVLVFVIVLGGGRLGPGRRNLLFRLWRMHRGLFVAGSGRHDGAG
jgi:hypothetical protein